MPEEVRKRTLLLAITKFKALKEGINQRKTAAPDPSVVSGEIGAGAPRAPRGGLKRQGGFEKKPVAGQMDGMTPQEALAVAVEEIKKTIRIEFEALRLELRSR